jgi:hypothetical protein
MVTWQCNFTSWANTLALKSFAQGPVGTASPWAKEGRRCARFRDLLNDSISIVLYFYISQQAIILNKLNEPHCLRNLA